MLTARPELGRVGMDSNAGGAYAGGDQQHNLPITIHHQGTHLRTFERR